jgi:hypothetical protein
MNPGVIILILCAALFHASWNAILRRPGDRLHSVTAVTALPFAFFLPLPAGPNWIYIGASAAVAGQGHGRAPEWRVRFESEADTVRALRADYPEVHFTACSDDDVLDPVKTVVERPGLRIYLVDGSDHCLSLTSDPQGATGLLLAEVELGAWDDRGASF